MYFTGGFCSFFVLQSQFNMKHVHTCLNWQKTILVYVFTFRFLNFKHYLICSEIWGGLSLFVQLSINRLKKWESEEF